MQPLAESLYDYGYQLGLAFQIADDLLDLTGDEQVTGKSLGTDLEKQKLTLPLIHFMQHADPQDRKQVESMLSGDSNDEEIARQRSQLPALLDRFGSIDYARGQAAKFAEAARLKLDALPDTDAKQSLVGLTKYVVKRRR